MTFKIFPYCLGTIAVVKSIRAVVFTFRPGKSADHAAVDACTGWLRHMGRFYANRTYTFTPDAKQAKGDVEVLLLDKKKQPLMKLAPQNPTPTIALDGKTGRYDLRWNFKRASGSCELRWRKQMRVPLRGSDKLHVGCTF